jgi:uncharacterized protein (TIGR02271 family)
MAGQEQETSVARSIAGLFPDRSSAEQAIRDLKAAGFDQDRIGVVMRDKGETAAVTEEHGTKSTEGAVAGGIIGGTTGAILAAVGALVIPGVGPFISGGILVSLIGGAAGWLVGGLAGLGIPEDEARYYEEQVGQGRALVTVDAQGRDAEARAILLRDGAEDLQGRGFGGSNIMDTAREPMASQSVGQQPVAQTTNDSDLRIPVHEEELVVGKQMEQEGQVHIHRDVTTERQTVSVPLKKERVTVDRTTFQGDATDMGDDAFVDRDIDVPVMGETAVVGKRVSGVEEVLVHKDMVTDQQQVGDTVRKERVVVDGADDSDQMVAGRQQAATAGGGTTLADRAANAAENVGDKLGNAKDRITDQ